MLAIKSEFRSWMYYFGHGQPMTQKIQTAWYTFIKYALCTKTPVPNDKILDSSKLKEFAEENSKFGWNVRKFSERVENTAGKAEIALDE